MFDVYLTGFINIKYLQTRTGDGCCVISSDNIITKFIKFQTVKYIKKIHNLLNDSDRIPPFKIYMISRFTN